MVLLGMKKDFWDEKNVFALSFNVLFLWVEMMLATIPCKNVIG